MATIANFMVKLGMNKSEFDSGIRTAGKQVDTFASKAKASAGIAGNSFSGMGRIIRGAAVAGAIIYATKQLITFGSECIKLGSDLEEVQNVVEVTFGKNTATIEKFAKSAKTNFGLSELAAKQYTGSLGAMFNSSGLEKQAATMSMTLTGLAGDFASFYNVSTDEAFTKVMAGMAGEMEPLRRWGITLSVANLEAYALSKGITASYESMSEANKMLLRYNYLLSVTSGAQGDFLRTSDSWANQLRILKLNWDEMKTALGQAFIAVLQPVLVWINTIIAGIAGMAQAFAAWVNALNGAGTKKNNGLGIEDLGNEVRDINKSTKTTVGNISAITTGTNAAAAAAQKAVMGFDEINKVSSEAAGSGSGGTGAGSGTIEIPEYTMPTISKITGPAADFSKLTDILDKLKPHFDDLADAGKKFYDKVLKPFGEWAIGEGLPSLLDFLTDTLNFFADNPEMLIALGALLLVLQGIKAIGNIGVTIGGLKNLGTGGGTGLQSPIQNITTLNTVTLYAETLIAKNMNGMPGGGGSGTGGGGGGIPIPIPQTYGLPGGVPQTALPSGGGNPGLPGGSLPGMKDMGDIPPKDVKPSEPYKPNIQTGPTGRTGAAAVLPIIALMAEFAGLGMLSGDRYTGNDKPAVGSGTTAADLRGEKFAANTAQKNHINNLKGVQVMTIYNNALRKKTELEELNTEKIGINNNRVDEARAAAAAMHSQIAKNNELTSILTGKTGTLSNGFNLLKGATSGATGGFNFLHTGATTAMAGVAATTESNINRATVSFGTLPGAAKTAADGMAASTAPGVQTTLGMYSGMPATVQGHMTTLAAATAAGAKGAADAAGEATRPGVQTTLGLYGGMPAAVQASLLALSDNVFSQAGTAGRALHDQSKTGVDNTAPVWSAFANDGTRKISTFAENVRLSLETVLRNMARLPSTAAGARGFSGLTSGFLDSIHNLPMFAAGGVATKPTVGVFGEAGAEAIVPLENNTGWIDKIAGQLIAAGGSGGGLTKADLYEVMSRVARENPNALFMDGRQMATANSASDTLMARQYGR